MPNPVGYNGDFDGTTHSPPVAIGNTYIQAGGLVGGAKPTHIAIDDVYKFDFDTMEWSKLPSLPKPIFGAGMVHEGECWLCWTAVHFLCSCWQQD